MGDEKVDVQLLSLSLNFECLYVLFSDVSQFLYNLIIQDTKFSKIYIPLIFSYKLV